MDGVLDDFERIPESLCSDIERCSRILVSVYSAIGNESVPATLKTYLVSLAGDIESYR